MTNTRITDRAFAPSVQKITRRRLLGAASSLPLLIAAGARPAAATRGWSKEQAASWRQRHDWLVGCNFIPSTAVNQLEMWQADTFDEATIDRELGWAASLGWNSVRVFLHDLLWQDPRGFISRMEKYLSIADRHGIGTLFVFFDSVWNPNPVAGPQPAPRPHVHNAGWVQSPGAKILGSSRLQRTMESYVRGVVGHFRNDRRVHGWDVFNEPDNTNRNSYGAMELADKEERAIELLRRTLTWARAERPTQPLTSGIWAGEWKSESSLRPLQRLMLNESDVISFHCYDGPEMLQEKITQLRRYGRPLMCTEFMARPQGSTFDPILEIMKRNEVASYAWGFVAGKTQTNYAWDSWLEAQTHAPDVWFHDLLHADGTPYLQSEVDYIRRVTGVARGDVAGRPRRKSTGREISHAPAQF